MSYDMLSDAGEWSSATSEERGPTRVSADASNLRVNVGKGI
jgi:hypothetical protein